ncbi:hypothetical protein DFH06DRAFT_89034 [Mycena polygramma]|nr:hypothetical protein DFH06DRAFT_89034 [Mycena polygramma]
MPASITVRGKRKAVDENQPLQRKKTKSASKPHQPLSSDEFDIDDDHDTEDERDTDDQEDEDDDENAEPSRSYIDFLLGLIRTTKTPEERFHAVNRHLVAFIASSWDKVPASVREQIREISPFVGELLSYAPRGRPDLTSAPAKGAGQYASLERAGLYVSRSVPWIATEVDSAKIPHAWKWLAHLCRLNPKLLPAIQSAQAASKATGKLAYVDITQFWRPWTGESGAGEYATGVDINGVLNIYGGDAQDLRRRFENHLSRFKDDGKGGRGNKVNKVVAESHRQEPNHHKHKGYVLVLHTQGTPDPLRFFSEFIFNHLVGATDVRVRGGKVKIRGMNVNTRDNQHGGEILVRPKSTAPASSTSLASRITTPSTSTRIPRHYIDPIEILAVFTAAEKWIVTNKVFPPSKDDSGWHQIGRFHYPGGDRLSGDAMRDICMKRTGRQWTAHLPDLPFVKVVKAKTRHLVWDGQKMKRSIQKRPTRERKEKVPTGQGTLRENRALAIDIMAAGRRRYVN